MPGLLNSSGRFKIASLFKLLMTIAMLLAFMPSLLKLGDSRLSVSYLYTIFCFAVMLLVLLRNRQLLIFYVHLAQQNKILFCSVLAMLLLHIASYAFYPASGLMSRTLMALIVFINAYLYFAFLLYRDDDDLQAFYKVINIGLIANFIVILLYANGYQFLPNVELSYDRHAGLFSHPNQLAIVVSSIFVFYVGSYFNDTKPVNRIKSLVMFLVAVVVSIMAGSKTNILISGVILIVYLLWSVSRKNALIVLLSIVVLTLLLGFAGSSDLVLKLNPRLFSVVAELSLDNVMQYRTVESRMVLWDYSWNTGMAYPYIGEGWGSSIFGKVEHSHNFFMDYLRLFGPLGLLSVGLFIVSLLALLSRGKLVTQHQHHLLKACKLSVLAYLLANMMSDSMGPQTAFFLAFFVAYLSAIPGRVYTFNPGSVYAARQVSMP
ncbi:MAG: O-antigen ligase family protein [Pseudomonadales bacterium]